MDLEAEDERVRRGEEGVLGYGSQGIEGWNLGRERAAVRDDRSRIVT